ncbi:MAG: hypothetical protein QXV22_00385 [Thermoplasmataceae archaeon]
MPLSNAGDIPGNGSDKPSFSNSSPGSPEGNDRQTPTNAKDLRVVEGIENGARQGKGIHVHILKSRDLNNAINYSRKIGSILSLHGFNIIEAIGEANDLELSQKAGSVTIYILDERYIERLRKEFNFQFPLHVSQLIRRSSLGNSGTVNVILALSDEYYSKILLERTQFPAADNAQIGSRERRKGTTTGKIEKRTALPFALFSFSIMILILNSVISSLAGEYGPINPVWHEIQIGSTDLFIVIYSLSLVLAIAAYAILSYQFANLSRSGKGSYIFSIVLFVLNLVSPILLASGYLNLGSILTSTPEAIAVAQETGLGAGAVFVAKMAPGLSIMIGNTGRGKVVASLSLVFASLLLMFLSPMIVSALPTFSILVGNPGYLIQVYRAFLYGGFLGPSMGYIPEVPLPGFYLNLIYLFSLAANLLVAGSLLTCRSDYSYRMDRKPSLNLRELAQ